MGFPANGFALDQLQKAAQGERMNLPEKGACAKGVSEMLREAGFTFGKEQGRPVVSTGFVGPNIWDYGQGKWIPVKATDHYVSKRSVIDKQGEADTANVKSSARNVEAKYFGHTLEMYGFKAILGILGGPEAKEKDIEAMSALPPGSIVIFGPCLPRSMQWEEGAKKQKVGGDGHPGHVGILLPKGDEAGKPSLLVVSDGGMRPGAQSPRHTPKKGEKGGDKSPKAGYHYHFLDDCILEYAWAVGFVPGKEPHNLVAYPKAYPEDYPMRRLPFTRICDCEPTATKAPPPPGWSRDESERILKVLGLPRSSVEPMSREPHFDPNDLTCHE